MNHMIPLKRQLLFRYDAWINSRPKKNWHLCLLISFYRDVPAVLILHLKIASIGWLSLTATFSEIETLCLIGIPGSKWINKIMPFSCESLIDNNWRRCTETSGKNQFSLVMAGYLSTASFCGAVNRPVSFSYSADSVLSLVFFAGTCAHSMSGLLTVQSSVSCEALQWGMVMQSSKSGCGIIL